MTTDDNIIIDTATRLFMDLSTPSVINDAEAGRWPAELWNTLEEMGLTLTWVPDTLGGAGAGIDDGFQFLRVAGAFSAPVPVAETLLAGLVLSCAGIVSTPGPMAVAPVRCDDRIGLSDDGRLKGTAREVPFARSAERIVVLARRDGKSVLAVVAPNACILEHGTSLAGEPRDNVRFDGVIPQQVADLPEGFDESTVEMLGATVRCMQMAGALQRILDQSVQYSTERVQFGRPIGKFQAVQHNLAELAGEVAAAGASADAAAEAIADWYNGSRPDVLVDVAAAKVRVGEAVNIGSMIAHQVHGAMGFTYEHSLHHSTRRLWCWRDEFGNESEWAIRLGEIVAKRGADELWPLITAAGHSGA